MSLTKNQSGAIMVMATFVAIFLVAIIYHVAGVGGAALEQQTMQDGADAITFSAASVNARGMNLIAIINRVMAFILAILVAVRLVQVLLMIVLGIFTVMCAIPWTLAVGCPVAAALADPTENITEVADKVEEIVNQVLPILHDAAEIVNEVVPFLAEAEAISISRSKAYKPPATIGFVWPAFDELPTTEGKFETLCAKAGENVGKIVFCFLPDHSKVKDVLTDLMGDMAKTFSDFFCGGDEEESGSSSGGESSGGSGDKPEVKMRASTSYPGKNHEECKDEGDSSVVDCIDQTASNYQECLSQSNAGGGASRNTIEVHHYGCAGAEGSLDGSCDCEDKSECDSCSRYGCGDCLSWLNGQGRPPITTENGSDTKYEKGLWSKRVDRWREYWDDTSDPDKPLRRSSFKTKHLRSLDTSEGGEELLSHLHPSLSSAVAGRITRKPSELPHDSLSARHEDKPPQWRFQEWEEEDRRFLVNKKGDPCKGADWEGSCLTGHPSNARSESHLSYGDDPPPPPDAICRFEKEVGAYTDSAGNQVRIKERVSWLYLHSCEVSENVRNKAKGNAVSNEEGDKNPRVLDMESYPERSKMRGFLIGKGKSDARSDKVAVDTKKKDGNGAFAYRVSMAAAEYYSPQMDLWHINWTARLIRFRLSYDEQQTGGETGSGVGSEGDDGEDSRDSSGPGGGDFGDVGGFGGGGGFGNGAQGLFSQCMPKLADECKQVQDALGMNGGSGMFSGSGDFGGMSGDFDMSGMSMEDLFLH